MKAMRPVQSHSFLRSNLEHGDHLEQIQLYRRMASLLASSLMVRHPHHRIQMNNFPVKKFSIRFNAILVSRASEVSTSFSLSFVCSAALSLCDQKLIWNQLGRSAASSLTMTMRQQIASLGSSTKDRPASLIRVVVPVSTSVSSMYS